MCDVYVHRMSDACTLRDICTTSFIFKCFQTRNEVKEQKTDFNYPLSSQNYV